MERTIIAPDTFDDAAGFEFSGPARFIFPAPLRGGPPLSEIRRVLGPRGKLRLSGTPARIFADVDPGEPEVPIVTLDMIVRSDAAGLQRAILSALPFVDAIVVGVDGRSDEETRKAAEAYADVVHVFQAEDIELSAEDWAADKIHFANARNRGRALVQTPWTFFLDSDEYLRRALDFRDVLRANAKAFAPFVAYEASVTIAGGAVTNRDCQRLAETRFRWWSQTHNQLAIMGSRSSDGVMIDIVEDRSLRTEAENIRRTQQRREGIEGMRAEAEAGNISAIFHLAKFLLATDRRAEGAKFAEDYRLRVEPHGPFADDRAWIAMQAAFCFYDANESVEAERWALRALFDGPCVEALCLLGDIREDHGDLATALVWYEMACVTPPSTTIKWPFVVDRRAGRRDGLRLVLGCYPEVAGVAATPETLAILGEKLREERGRQFETPLPPSAPVAEAPK
jgi:hypothetical protein